MGLEGAKLTHGEIGPHGPQKDEGHISVAEDVGMAPSLWQGMLPQPASLRWSWSRVHRRFISMTGRLLARTLVADGVVDVPGRLSLVRVVVAALGVGE